MNQKIMFNLVVAGKYNGFFFSDCLYSMIGNILNNHPDIYPETCLVVKIDKNNYELVTNIDKEAILKAFTSGLFPNNIGLRKPFIY